MKLDLSRLSDLLNEDFGARIVDVASIESTTRWCCYKSAGQRRSNGRYITSGSMIVLKIHTPDYVLDVDCGMGRDGKKTEKAVRGLIQ